MTWRRRRLDLPRERERPARERAGDAELRKILTAIGAQWTTANFPPPAVRASTSVRLY
jgi:hypothetical protein